MTPSDYCQQKAAQSRSSFYYSFRFLPPPKRQAITALYALCREVDDVVDQSQNPEIAATTLTWWHEEITRAYEGLAQHPVTRALEKPIQDYHLPRNAFDQLLAGMMRDLFQKEYSDLSELEGYCYQVAGTVGELIVHILGFQHPETLRYATTLGLALQLTNIIRDVREDAQQGRIYLPQDWLMEYQLHSRDILAYQDSPPLNTLLKALAERAYHAYQEAFAILPKEDRCKQRIGILMGTLYRALLDEIANDGFQVMHHRIHLTPLHKIWIVWKTYWYECYRYRC